MIAPSAEPVLSTIDSILTPSLTPRPSASFAAPLTGPKLKRYLAQKIGAERKKLFDWQMALSRDVHAPFYSSVDLRDAGYKIGPVDSNLYPAGFNNICPDDLRTSPSVVKAHLEVLASQLGIDTPKKLVLIPESHTSNGYYIENLHYLCQILTEAGFDLRVGWMGEPMAPSGGADDGFDLISVTEKKVRVYPFRVVGGRALAGGLEADVVLLNNDFSGGYPELLDEVTVPILPTHTLGWHTRKKSEHFVHYNALAKEFADLAQFDPWLIQVDTEGVDEVNFSEDLGIDRVTASVERVLKRAKQAHLDRGIDREPFVFVKNNSGTYGMGIMVIHSLDEMHSLNRRSKNKMSVGKNKRAIESVVVQEGIPTATLVDRLPAEPVIYLVGSELIGGFLRTNSERGAEDNLNSQGMVFRKLCMSDLRRPLIDEDAHLPSDEVEPVMELVYGSIARISALAAGREIAAQLEQA